MNGWYIFLIVIGSIAFTIIFIYSVVRGSKRRMLRRWRVGDLLILRWDSDQQKLQEGWDYAKLVAVNMDEVIVDFGGSPDTRSALEHSDIKTNKSYLWRKKYYKARRLMGPEWENASNYTKNFIIKQRAKETLGLDVDETNTRID